MTVKELMKFLEKYPDNLRVVVNGYEDIVMPTLIRAAIP